MKLTDVTSRAMGIDKGNGYLCEGPSQKWVKY